MKIIAIAFRTFLIIFIFSFLFSSCEKEIIESEISQEETASKLEIKGSEIKSKGNPGQFFYLPGPGEMVGFHHVPYSGHDSMILRFYSDLQAYDSINSIASKWQEQMGMPLWAESVVLENDSGQTSFAVIPFTENGSTELKTIFVLAEYQGHWFFEGWNVRLVKKAIDAEGEPDEKMQTLIDFYNFYYYGHWDPNSGAEARSTTIVCERIFSISHGSNICLEVCLYCMSRAFASIECPGPYDFVHMLEINPNCPGGDGPGGGSGSEPSDPLLNIGEWNPYFGPIMTDGNPISWVSNEGMADPVWPGGVSGPLDDIDDGQEKYDRTFKGTELFLLLRDMIEDMGLDITLLDLRDLLLEDDLECLEDDAPEVCVMLLLIGEEIAPEIIPASFKNNTTLSTAELVSFSKLSQGHRKLTGAKFFK